MKFTEETIFKYLDGELTDQEIHLFNNELENNKPFTKLFEQIKSIDASLKDNQLASPSAQFAEKIMATVNLVNIKEARFFNGTRILSLSLILIVIAASLYYFAIHFYPSLGATISDQITLKGFTINLQPANQLLNSTVLFKIVLYVNGIISLLLLDRAILNPYFSRRKQRYSI